MAYQLFRKKSSKVAEPRLTIRGKQIALNEAAVDLIGEKGARWFHILWDPEKRKMAIRPTPKQDDDSYYLSPRGGKKGGVLSGSLFLKYIGWPIGTPPFAVKPHWNGRDHVLEVTLPQQSPSAAGRKVK